MNRVRKVPSDPQEAFEAAMNTAYNILSYRDNPPRLLSDKLKEHGYSEETVENVLSALKKSGVLNEDRMIKNEIRRLACSKHFGRSRIRSELYARGYSSEAISSVDYDDPVLSDIDFDLICLELLRKLGGERDTKTLNRLRYYGHSGDSIRYAYSALKEGEDA